MVVWKCAGMWAYRYGGKEASRYRGVQVCMPACRHESMEVWRRVGVYACMLTCRHGGA